MSTGEGWPHQGSASLGVPLAAAPPSDLGDNWDTQRLGSCQKAPGQSPQETAWEEACSSLQRDIKQLGLQVTKEGRGWTGGGAWTAGPQAEQREVLLGADQRSAGASQGLGA